MKDLVKVIIFFVIIFFAIDGGMSFINYMEYKDKNITCYTNNGVIEGNYIKLGAFTNDEGNTYITYNNKTYKCNINE